MFEDRTQENIKAEMLALIQPETGVSTQMGSYADATVGAAAFEVSELYQALPAVVSMLFVDENSGRYIDLVGETYFNIHRKTGRKSRCDIILQGKPGTTLMAGTQFLTATGLVFILVTDVYIQVDGTARGTLEAINVGAAYNVQAGEISQMYINPVGLTSYTNQMATGGTDQESDTELLRRIQERRQKPTNGSNGWQYRAWAMAVSGVGEAKVVELAQGAGTVGITIVDGNLEPGSQELVSACFNAIQHQRPVGATPIVTAPEKAELSLKTTVVISPATTAETVQRELKNRLRAYLTGVIQSKYGQVYYKPSEDLPYTVIYNRILALILTIEGVENASSLTLNDGTADITIEANQIPTIKVVEVIV